MQFKNAQAHHLHKLIAAFFYAPPPYEDHLEQIKSYLMHLNESQLATKALSAKIENYSFLKIIFLIAAPEGESQQSETPERKQSLEKLHSLLLVFSKYLSDEEWLSFFSSDLENNFHTIVKMDAKIATHCIALLIQLANYEMLDKTQLLCLLEQADYHYTRTFLKELPPKNSMSFQKMTTIVEIRMVVDIVLHKTDLNQISSLIERVMGLSFNPLLDVLFNLELLKDLKQHFQNLSADFCNHFFQDILPQLYIKDMNLIELCVYEHQEEMLKFLLIDCGLSPHVNYQQFSGDVVQLLHYLCCSNSNYHEFFIKIVPWLENFVTTYNEKNKEKPRLLAHPYKSTKHYSPLNFILYQGGVDFAIRLSQTTPMNFLEELQLANAETQYPLFNLYNPKSWSFKDTQIVRLVHNNSPSLEQLLRILFNSLMLKNLNQDCPNLSKVHKKNFQLKAQLAFNNILYYSLFEALGIKYSSKSRLQQLISVAKNTPLECLVSIGDEAPITPLLNIYTLLSLILDEYELAGHLLSEEIGKSNSVIKKGDLKTILRFIELLLEKWDNKAGLKQVFTDNGYHQMEVPALKNLSHRLFENAPDRQELEAQIYSISCALSTITVPIKSSFIKEIDKEFAVLKTQLNLYQGDGAKKLEKNYVSLWGKWQVHIRQTSTKESVVYEESKKSLLLEIEKPAKEKPIKFFFDGGTSNKFASLDVTTKPINPMVPVNNKLIKKTKTAFTQGSCSTLSQPKVEKKLPNKTLSELKKHVLPPPIFKTNTQTLPPKIIRPVLIPNSSITFKLASISDPSASNDSLNNTKNNEVETSKELVVVENKVVIAREEVPASNALIAESELMVKTVAEEKPFEPIECDKDTLLLHYFILLNEQMLTDLNFFKIRFEKRRDEEGLNAIAFEGYQKAIVLTEKLSHFVKNWLVEQNAVQITISLNRSELWERIGTGNEINPTLCIKHFVDALVMKKTLPGTKHTVFFYLWNDYISTHLAGLSQLHSQDTQQWIKKNTLISSFLMQLTHKLHYSFLPIRFRTNKENKVYERMLKLIDYINIVFESKSLKTQCGPLIEYGSHIGTFFGLDKLHRSDFDLRSTVQGSLSINMEQLVQFIKESLLAVCVSDQFSELYSVNLLSFAKPWIATDGQSCSFELCFLYEKNKIKVDLLFTMESSEEILKKGPFPFSMCFHTISEGTLFNPMMFFNPKLLLELCHFENGDLVPSSPEQINLWMQDPSKVAFMLRMMSKLYLYPQCANVNLTKLVEASLNKLVEMNSQDRSSLIVLSMKKSLMLAGFIVLLVENQWSFILGLDNKINSPFLNWIKNIFLFMEQKNIGSSKPDSELISFTEFVALMLLENYRSTKHMPINTKIDRLRALGSVCLNNQDLIYAVQLVIDINHLLETGYIPSARPSPGSGRGSSSRAQELIEMFRLTHFYKPLSKVCSYFNSPYQELKLPSQSGLSSPGYSVI